MEESSEGQKYGPQYPTTFCQHNAKFEETKVDQLIKEYQL
jgi:hypothetical protein